MILLAVAQLVVGQPMPAPPRAGSAHKWIDGRNRDLSKGAEIQNFDVTVAQSGIEITSSVNLAGDVYIHDGTLRLKAPASPSSYPIGIVCERAAGKLLVERVTAVGFTERATTKDYMQGDGFGTEFCPDVTYRDTKVVGAGNGGHDDKAYHVTYDRVTIEDAAYCIRRWWRGPGSTDATDITCRDPRVAAIHLMASDKGKGNADMAIAGTLRVSFTDGHPVTPILIAQAGTTFSAARCVITAQTIPAKPVAFGGTKAKRTLGPGCADAAGNIVFAAPEPTGNFIWLPKQLRDGDGDGKIDVSVTTRKELSITARQLRPTDETSGAAWRYQILR